MTVSEAVYTLRNILDQDGGIDYGTRTQEEIDRFDMAYGMAIKALEESVGKMTIEKAVVRLFEYWQKALVLNEEKNKVVIFDPVAWALYQTWKDADREEKK